MLEDKGVKILELESDPAVDGFSTWVENAIPVIALNKSLKKHLDRYRFTTLHELGLKDSHNKKHEKLCHHFAGTMLLDILC